jgi:succinate-semialdehyde dehydrogenase
MSNAMFALKGGNAIIITPHHKSVRCSARAVELINAELDKLGAPKNLIQVLDQQSRENTKNLISSADVVIATGGMGMVKAAYSSGKPALGVGAGNVQCIIDDDADIETAAPKIIAGRIFDNGIICSGEQSIIMPETKYDEMMKEFEELKKAAEPFIDFLYKYYHPHATILISQANMEVVEGVAGIPMELRD